MILVTMVDLILLQKLFTALAIGLIVGFEREIAQERQTRSKAAGLRTFGLAGLAGGIAAYLAQGGLFVLVAALLGLTALIGIAYYRATSATSDIGLTTEISLILTFLLGGMAYYEWSAAIIITVVVAFILAFKQPMHEFTHRIPKEEFYDSLKFALIAIVILPILPNQYYGLPQYGLPELINPFQIWSIVVIISGLSFVGYFLVKWLGPQEGLALTGILGGMTSSTAVTTTMATNTSAVNGMENESSVAATLANTVMLARVCVLVLLFNPALLAFVVPPMAAMGIAGLLMAGYFYLKSTHKVREGEAIKLRSPFSLRPALTFAAFIAVILFVSKTAAEYFGSYGLYATALFAGLADVDALTISASDLAAGGQAAPAVAVIAILIAVFVNLLIRIVYAYYFGTRKFGANMAVMALTMLGAGVASALIYLSGTLGT